MRKPRFPSNTFLFLFNIKKCYKNIIKKNEKYFYLKILIYTLEELKWNKNSIKITDT